MSYYDYFPSSPDVLYDPGAQLNLAVYGVPTLPAMNPKTSSSVSKEELPREIDNLTKSQFLFKMDSALENIEYLQRFTNDPIPSIRDNIFIAQGRDVVISAEDVDEMRRKALEPPKETHDDKLGHYDITGEGVLKEIREVDRTRSILRRATYQLYLDEKALCRRVEYMEGCLGKPYRPQDSWHTKDINFLGQVEPGGYIIKLQFKKNIHKYTLTFPNVPTLSISDTQLAAAGDNRHYRSKEEYNLSRQMLSRTYDQLSVVRHNMGVLIHLQMRILSRRESLKQIQNSLRNQVYPLTARLPPEVMQMIFGYCLSWSSYGISVNPASTKDSPQNISLVCHHWRALATKAYWLWSSVTVMVEDNPTTANALDLWFTRAMNAPISLRITGGRYNHSLPLVLSICLRKHMHKVQNLLLDRLEEWTAKDILCILGNSSRPRRKVEVTTLNMHPKRLPPVMVPQQYITTLRLSGLWVDRSSIHNSRWVYLREDFVLGILGKCPQLISCTIHDMEPTEVVPSDRYDTPLEAPMQYQEAYLRHLQFLEIRGQMPGRILRWLTVPNLVKLVLETKLRNRGRATNAQYKEEFQELQRKSQIVVKRRSPSTSGATLTTYFHKK